MQKRTHLGGRANNVKEGEQKMNMEQQELLNGGKWWALKGS